MQLTPTHLSPHNNNTQLTHGGTTQHHKGEAHDGLLGALGWGHSTQGLGLKAPTTSML